MSEYVLVLLEGMFLDFNTLVSNTNIIEYI